VAQRTGRLLAIGHQRHYSYLYANALEVARQRDILGDVRHIRAFWHRNQTEGGRPGAERGDYDTWFPKIAPEDAKIDAARYGYRSVED
jgi:predicted dehydrogenase